MDSLMWNLFICIALPMALSLFLMKGRARVVVASLVVGMFMCMFAGAVNGLIRKAIGASRIFEITTIYTPMTEEIAKAIPVFLFAVTISDEKERIVPMAMAVGIGFAIIENAYILISEMGSWGPLSALARVFGASLMHGVCTSVVGLGMSLIYKRRKLFVTGTLALLTVAMTYHGIFNALVQSSYSHIGLHLPIFTFVPILILVEVQYRKQAREKAAAENENRAKEAAENEKKVQVEG